MLLGQCGPFPVNIKQTGNSQENPSPMSTQPSDKSSGLSPVVKEDVCWCNAGSVMVFVALK